VLPGGETVDPVPLARPGRDIKPGNQSLTGEAWQGNCENDDPGDRQGGRLIIG
jgi:hypothetical protein